MLNHDEILRLLPYGNDAIRLDEVTELDCLKSAEGIYYLIIPSSEEPMRLSEIRFSCMQAILETAGVAVFCSGNYDDKLMDFLNMDRARFDIDFLEAAMQFEADTVIELSTEVEILETSKDSATAAGIIKYDKRQILEISFDFWLLTAQELKDRNGKLG